MSTFLQNEQRSNNQTHPALSSTNYIVVLSGGMDSATVLGHVMQTKNENDRAKAIFFKYGQNTQDREEWCVDKLCVYYGVKCEKIPMQLRGDTLISNEEHPICSSKNYEVVGRNPIMALFALNVGMKYFGKDSKLKICLGIQGSDDSDYVDCSKEAVVSLGSLIGVLTNGQAELYIPFLECDKKKIVGYGSSIGVPYEYTWSCYVNSETPCGVCPSCKLREEAFKQWSIGG